jgi:hypothetical protein
MAASSPNSFGSFLEAMRSEESTESPDAAMERLLELLAKRGPLPMAQAQNELTQSLSTFLTAYTKLIEAGLVTVDGEPPTLSLTATGRHMAQVA